ncbi:MAG: C40 family peptidase [Gemmatimonadaceae bacterium]
MRRSLLLAALALFLLPLTAEAQRSTRVRKKPFAAFSESAERLKDSLSSRVEAMTRAPLIAPSVDRETALRDSIVAVARSQIGTPYRLGAELPGKAFDCSGFVRYVLAALHLTLPRTAHEQSQVGQLVERDTAALRPGDLIAWGSGRRVTHIGIYVGDGRVVHASTSKRRVVESSMESETSWFQRRWMGARRLLAVEEVGSDSTIVR